MARIGIFICHCGNNIAGAVDIAALVERVSHLPDVVFATDYKFLCSAPGQQLIADKIVEHKLDAVVNAHCSPTLHERTFRNVAASVGLNPYRLEVANIREQVSWPHWHDKELATKKAFIIIKQTLEKVRRNIALDDVKIPITRSAMVIGGGIAGIQASLDIADAGYEVYLIEKSPSIGGKMLQLSETFPTLDCPQCIATPKMTDVANHPNINLMAYSEVEKIDGYIGNFKATVRHKASYIDNEKCTGCGACMEKCPSKKIPSEFERGISNRTAVYIPFAQAVPNYPVIDADNCIHFKTGKCGLCQKVCPVDAIDFEQVDRFEEIEIGAVVIATGYELYPLEEIPEYGGGKIPDVIDALTMERILAPAGPTNGIVKRPSDGKIPKSVAFIHCVRSRDPEHGVPYCSRICCMYLIKQAMLYKHAVEDGHAYDFYIDLRTNGKGYEEFYQRAQEEDWITFIRGKPARIIQNGDKVQIWSTDTLSGRQIKLDVDMVVLAPAMIPSKAGQELLKKLRLATDEYGWVKEQHLKLRPLESMTGGIFIAGVAQYPKDITDTVAQASGAVAKVLDMFGQPELVRSPTIARVDQEICAGCGYCEKTCPYEAIKVDEVKKVAFVNEALCEGCGACAASCPSGAVQHTNFFKGQIFSMVLEATRDYE
ncbi:CoB--CoM heterodisulfide reductase iron-sulfur subunit A family protein [bacterium]|nr:CoB--CoM heterodisulfide reductase iron-sulfur subunit A family protein [bacterium]